MRDLATKGVAIGGQPIRYRGNLGQLEIAEDELARFRFVFNRNFVAGFHIVGSNVYAAPIYQHMTVRHQLPGGAPRIGQAEAIDDVIESGFEKLEERFASHTALPKRVLEDAPKLPLQKPILITELLLFTERNCVLRLFSSGASRAVHARRIIFSLQRFRLSEDRHAITAADFRFWSGVSAHGVR